MKTHCRQWVCGHCDCLVISLIFRLTTFDVRIRRQKSSKSANRVFYISLKKGYFGKTIFSRLFSARYHILKKKKKKKTILGLCRCSVDNYSLNPGDLPCQFKPHQIFRAVAAMAETGVCKITCKTVENWLRYQRKTLRRRCHNVGSVLCINNFWSTQSNSAKFTGQLP